MEGPPPSSGSEVELDARFRFARSSRSGSCWSSSNSSACPWTPAVGRFRWRRVAGVVVADMASVRHVLGIGGPSPRAARVGFSQQGRRPSPPAAPSRADTSGPRNRVTGDAASGAETPTGAGAEPCADGAIC